jgi:phospholipid/cholesterol/gamma-HCH transport system substrate-binding protein
VAQKHSTVPRRRHDFQELLNMRVNNRTRIQLAILALVTLIAGGVMTTDYMKLPNLLFGFGHYTVRLELPEAAGLYATGNVTYRGTEVGRVQSVHLTSSGVEAELSLTSGVDIPSDLDAQIHSTSAIGEQYVALLPRSGDSAPLRNGDVIRRDRASVPPKINDLLDAGNAGLRAIPQDNLKTAVDESYVAIGGLGPDLSRLVKGSTKLAIDARRNLEPLTTLIDQASPVLDSQVDTSGPIQEWAAHLATITSELRYKDGDIAGLLQKSGPAADEARRLFERLQPTLPILLANLVSIGQVAISYQNDIEQLLVLVPQGLANLQGTFVATADNPSKYVGQWQDFALNLNLPPPCTTGYLPATQIRSPVYEDHPERPRDDLYCRIPQDSPFNVRGLRNIPCETKPWKRAPTAQMCESDEEYVPLNSGFNWKGDPNATLSGQGIPQTRPGEPAPPESVPGAPPPIAVAPYDPATGTYIGPDGQIRRAPDLAINTPKEKSWQSMLIPRAD